MFNSILYVLIHLEDIYLEGKLYKEKQNLLVTDLAETLIDFFTLFLGVLGKFLFIFGLLVLEFLLTILW